jgi:tRNA-Thr(GGU) m(6)t(6)A37 methyltransferase TsaA
MARERDLILRPIGRVAQGLSPGQPRPRQEETVAEIEIEPSWTEALDGIEGFSHIWVVWCLDRSNEPPESLKVRPEGRADMPPRGIFATRSPRRPNPIAMTAVRLLERQGSRLRVQGLDAFEDTPVLDLKPYLRRGDLVPEATSPEWIERLWAIHDQERDS